MRTITRSEFQNAAGEAVYVSHVHYQSRAEQAAGDAACLAVVAAEAFVPALSAGPAFDSPEAIGSAQRIPGGYHVTLPPLEQGEAAQLIAPPNCEGFAHAGEVLAHAQHEAAIDGDDCTSGACLITRGSD